MIVRPIIGSVTITEDGSWMPENRFLYAGRGLNIVDLGFVPPPPDAGTFLFYIRSGSVYVMDSNGVETNLGGSTDAFTVGVTNADTTPGFLASKLIAGSNVTLTINNVGANETITIDVAGGGVTFWTEAESAAVQLTTSFTPNNVAAAVNAAFIPKGTGALIAATPDGTPTGGNARGNYAVDLQLQRAVANQVAGGANSAIVGGQNNLAGQLCFIGAGAGNDYSAGYATAAFGEFNIGNALWSLVYGYTNTVNGWYSIVGGRDHVTESDYSAIFGRQHTVAAGHDYNLVAGQGHTIQGDWHIVAGQNNNLNFTGLTHCVTLGYNNVHANNGGQYAVVIGANNTINGAGSGVAIVGRNNTGSGGAAFGRYNTFASGSYAIGDTNTLGTAQYSFAVGLFCNSLFTGSTATYAMAFGTNAQLEMRYARHWAGGYAVAVGDVQKIEQFNYVVTTDNTPTRMLAGFGSYYTSLVDDSAYGFKALLVARRTDANGENLFAEITGMIVMDAGVPRIVGAVIITRHAEDAGAAAWVIAVSADAVNDALDITVTGEVGKTIKWGADVTLMKVTG